MTEWQRVVSDLEADGILLVQDGNHGEYRPRPAEFGNSGTAFIRAADMRGGRLLFESAQKINEIARERVRKGIGAPCDVILSHKGTVGKVAFAPAVSPPFVCSPQTTFWRSLNHEAIDPLYLYAFLQSEPFKAQLRARENESDMAAYVSLTEQRRLSVTVPPLEIQRAISGVLGALDDKIAVNERVAAMARELGLTFYSQSLHDDDSTEVVVDSVATALTRGVAPKYADSSDELTVLNQKCIRDGRVNLEPSRLTLREKVKAPKLLQLNDVLVNSTGVGTLGRVARWTLDLDATVDSHITIVRFNESKVDPVCAGFAMLRAQPEIEAMGEGSTGQTELRRSQVGELELTLPGPAGQKELRPKLDALEERADQALRESLALANLRDTLLPQLMSGKLRVRDAEKIVEDAV
ncbi:MULTISPECIES: restriction endonuclease subunit S [Streptomyces]|uniref:Restriction endonuclease subunit S n=1 Tax=Streptomyces sp. R21 TaxID=3238627 RepID=A0AB39P914_9ACTN|nr:restriction endonuclease subunit S [Streptomyces aurantiacus]